MSGPRDIPAADAPRPPLTRDPAASFAALVRGSSSPVRPFRGDAGVAVPFPDRRTADDRRP
ncbi:hypothetical protein ACIHFC_24285 [Streptomyces sp. NPDC052013]|uniref:hypothetical protein n=1 Tax=Streptomyces sp. NPDC052013 TaxID=3365679 RepID=UPI0037D5D23C